MSPEYLAQHKREINILTQLQHPNIVRAIGVESEVSTELGVPLIRKQKGLKCAFFLEKLVASLIDIFWNYGILKKVNRSTTA